MSAAIRRGPAEEGGLDPTPESSEVVFVDSLVPGNIDICALAGRWELDIPRPDNKRAAVARRESNIAFMPSEFLMYSLLFILHHDKDRHEHKVNIAFARVTKY